MPGIPWPKLGGPGATRHTYELVGQGDNGEAGHDAPLTSTGRANRLPAWLPSGTALVLVFVAFALGYFIGDARSGAEYSVPHTEYPSAVGDSSALEILRALPKVDLLKEYGLDETKFGSHYPPLGKKMCIIHADNRPWSPPVNTTGTAIGEKDYHGFGILNHFTYALYHGYTFKRIKVPQQPGYHGTWAKPLAQFRTTMSSDCTFVLLMDADMIWQDIRVPLEALLGHWNVTKDDALIGAVDLGKGDTGDIKGNPYINTGYIITQKTKVLPNLMRDWINCPTGVKYAGCELWAETFYHEQSALSNYIRYDKDYAPYIRELPCDEVHWPGKYTRHLWGNTKPEMNPAAKEAIASRIIPSIMEEMSRTWESEIYDHVDRMEDYDYLMDPNYTGER